MENRIDVICQHSRDGGVIPLRIRVPDDEGALHAYTIKEYRDLSHRGAYTTPDGLYVTNNIDLFECRIVVFGQRKTVRLYYNRTENTWTMGSVV